MTLRRRAFVLAAAVLAAALLLAGVLLQGAGGEPLEDAERIRAERGWQVAARLLELDPELRLDPVRAASELGALLDVRVTLVDPSGRVLGDSAIPDGDVAAMENHRARPEIDAALGGGMHVRERPSPTEGIQTLYVAGLVPEVGMASPSLSSGPAVLRVAIPAEPFRGALGRTSAVLLLVGAGGILALVVLVGAGGVDGSLRRGLSRLERGVAGAATGGLDALPDPDRLPRELSGVGSALHRMADEVRDRTREVLRERDELLSLVDAIAEGVVALSDDARVLRMNQAAARLLDGAMPAPFAPIGTLVRHPQLRDHLEESVVLPLPPREFSVGERNLLVSTHLLESGGSVVTLLDVSDLRRMEKVRRDFVANASHELKTPLTAMRGFAETLLDGDPPEALRREFLGSIRSNSVRLQNLVDDLLDLSRLEAGAWTVQEEEVELADAVRDVWEELMRGRQDPRVSFRVEGDAVALADAQALHQVYRNLLDNALRFTPDGGRIEVHITPQGPEVEVAVSDSGAGIPSSALPRIFERFYRADTGRDRAAGGTGLGLAIVRHIVQSMGGEVWAESQLGVGTTIRFTLPMVEGG